MGFMTKSIREENDRLKAQINELNMLLTPELRDIQSQRYHLQNLNSQIAMSNDILQKQHNEINQNNAAISNLQNIIYQKQALLVDIDEQISFEEVGMYQPTYEFSNSSQYAEQLKYIRNEQKLMIKMNAAVVGGDTWTVNGSIKEGKKMADDMKKLLLRTFNGECDDIISKVKYNTFPASEKRILTSYNSICKLASVMGIYITTQYYNSKIQELHLALDYRMKKQAEKEEQAALRLQMREEAKLQKEIEEARKLSEKEKNHYQNALKKIIEQIENASPENVDILLQKKNEIESHLKEIESSLQAIDYREANIKAGYVYVISNIGAFGENVYKIGMTRRLNPMERIDELGDASVPFNFDVHAMIFSDDAPKLEAALHKAFENRKLNMINTRREFFRVSLNEIKQVISENYDKTVEYIEKADAEQYRMSEAIRHNQ